MSMSEAVTRNIRVQVLAEYAPDASVWVADSRNLRSVQEFTLQQLLPGAFLDVPREFD